MATRPRGRPDADVSRADAARARTLARAVAARVGLDRGGGGDGAGTRPAHDRRVARQLLPRRASEHHLPPRGWLPPALNAAQNAAQQARLQAAVQEAPRAAGIAAGDWTWKVVRTFCRERFGIV